MPHVAPWYRREDYARVREIMADGDRFPPSFDAWEKTAKKQMGEAKREGLARPSYDGQASPGTIISPAGPHLFCGYLFTHAARLP